MQSSTIRRIAILVALASCLACGGDSEVAPATGPWRAWLDSPGGDLPFGLELEHGPAGWSATVINANESILVPRVDWNGERLLLEFVQYDSVIEATPSQRGVRLDGEWRRTRLHGEQDRLAFHAEASRATRFTLADPGDTTDAVRGRWAVRFDSESEPATAEFEVGERGAVRGTFRTPTGDYRYLGGNTDGRLLRLSTFDGAHAFLFHARIAEDGSLRGDFWSRGSWHDTWTAVRDDHAELSTGFDRTVSIDGIDLADLVYPDLEGVPRSLADPAFAGKARIIEVFGTWCPNCNDAAEYLVQLDRRYRSRGLSIVAVAFEMTGEFDRDASQVRRWADHLEVRYPILIGGLADKAAASQAFPLLDRIRAYPTTIFVDSHGRIDSVHSGYDGPATGVAHQRLRREFESRIDALLGDAAEAVP